MRIGLTHEAVKEALDECAGKSTNDIIDEINNSIYVNILNEFELFPDDNADDIDEDEDEDAVFNNTTSNSKQQPKSQLFTNYAMNDLGSRKSTPYTSFGRPFSRKEFLDAFNITEDDLFEKKIAFNKFDSVIPEEFINKFEMATIADQYLNDQNNMHVTFQVVPNFDTNDTLPVWFIIYKDENGSFKCHVSHSCNLVTEDCKPLSFYDVFNKPAVEEVMKGNNPMNNLNNALAGLAQMFGINSPASKAITGPMTEQEAMKYLFKEYLMKEYTDESTHEGKASIEILKTFNHPSLTINELGTIIESDVVKQIGDGYMYVGDLKLNDSEDVKYFLSDFGVTAEDGKIELYIRVAYNKIDNDKLPHAKDFVKAIDISRDIFKTNVELYVNRSRNFVYFDFDK